MSKVLLLALLLSQSAYAVEQDKMLHFAVSYASVLSANAVLKKTGCSESKARLLAAGLVLLAGATKELTDSQFDQDDFGADALGAAAGVAFTFFF